jgi:hypothetical protein
MPKMKKFIEYKQHDTYNFTVYSRESMKYIFMQCIESILSNGKDRNLKNARNLRKSSSS